MKNQTFNLLLLSGIVGSLLMYIGDMLLYYEPVSGFDYDSTARMSTMPIGRLISGGLIGLFASMFYIIGGYFFYILFNSANKILAKLLFVNIAIMCVFAGSYHAMFPYLGFVGRLPESFQSEQLAFIRTYLDLIKTLMFVFAIIWTLILFYLVIFKKTLYPKWMLLLTPILLILAAGFVKDYIPYPFGAIIYGGWINLSFMLFFIVCLIHFSKKSIKSKINNFELKNEA